MAETPATGVKVLKVGILTRPHTQDPQLSRDAVSSLVVGQVFETPFSLGKHEGSRPRLFDGPLKLEGSGPGGAQVFSAAVQPGIRFSDGTVLNAAHVAASLGRVEALREHARIETQGERVFFHLKAPNPRFDLFLTMVHASITLDQGELLGTGAYRFAPSAGNAAVRLVRNPHHRRPVAIDEVHFVVYPPDADDHPTALLKAVESGEVDYTGMLSRADVGALQGVRKTFQPSNSTAILHFNASRPALSDARVRRALSLAVNRPAITELAYSNVIAFTATTLLPPVMGISMDRHPFDPDRARKLLSQPGVVRPGRLELLVTWAPRPYLPNPHQVASALARQLSDLGVEVAITTPRDAAEYFGKQERGEYDLILGGWIADTPDPADFLESNLASDRVPAPGKRGVATCNLSRIHDHDLDEALRRFRADPQDANRNHVLDLVAELSPLLPLMYGPTVVVTAWRVQNVELSPLGLPDFGAFSLQG